MKEITPLGYLRKHNSKDLPMKEIEYFIDTFTPRRGCSYQYRMAVMAKKYLLLKEELRISG
jgi:hypothetical protein